VVAGSVERQRLLGEETRVSSVEREREREMNKESNCGREDQTKFA
jgi:hypothetical protein